MTLRAGQPFWQRFNSIVERALGEAWGRPVRLLQTVHDVVLGIPGWEPIVTNDPMSLSVMVSAEAPADAAAVERLSERAFGPGRFARTAYRVREAAAADPALSFVARISTLLVGANRMTEIRCGTAPGLLLGPLTVDPAFRSRGIGAALVERSLNAATAAGHRLVMLVGDEAYYGRFGFVCVPSGRLTMPGPVDPARVLFRELQPDGFVEAKGIVVAWAG